MEILFYNTASENSRIGKTLENEYSLTGNFKGEVNLQAPVFAVQADLLNYNYCYVPLLERYYFIEKIEIIRKGLFTVYLKIDVLETYKESIKKLKVVISRSSNSNPYYNGYINGVDVRTDYETKEFQNNFDETGQIVLVALYGERSEIGGN